MEGIDYNRIYFLLEKYGMCATSVEEERELRLFFEQPILPVEFFPYRGWFSSEVAESLPPLGEEFDQRVLLHIRQEKKKKWQEVLIYCAASVLFLLLLIILIALAGEL